MPRAALLYSGEQAYVFIADRKKAKRRDVKTGVRDGDAVEITDGLTPMTLPSLKTFRDGMLKIWKRDEDLGFSSTLHLPTFKCSFISSAISVTAGETILHGTHQGAQKSTRTGLPAPNTSWSKFWSVICTSISPFSPVWQGVRH